MGLGGRKGLFVPASHEECESSCRLDADLRILRRQTLGPVDTVDRGVRFTDRCLYPAAEQPGPGQVGIERQRQLDESISIRHLTTKLRKRESAGAQGYRVVRAELDGAPGQSLRLPHFLRPVAHPAARIARGIGS